MMKNKKVNQKVFQEHSRAGKPKVAKNGEGFQMLHHPITKTWWQKLCESWLTTGLWGLGGNPFTPLQDKGPAKFQKEKLCSITASYFFSVRSAPPPSLLPGSAQYYWSTANSKLANQQGSKLIIQLTVEKLKFFIKGKWNTVNLCFNGAFPHVAFTLLVLWLYCEAVTRPKNDRSFTDLKIRQVLSPPPPLHDDFSSYNYCNSLIMEDNMAGKQARKKVW